MAVDYIVVVVVDLSDTALVDFDRGTVDREDIVT